MANQFLTIEYGAGNNTQYVVTRVNGRDVEQYERDQVAASQPTSKSPQVQLITQTQQRILSTYLNELGDRGWDFCAILNGNMLLLKKPAYY